MARKFKTVDYKDALEMTVKVKMVLPADHLVHFIVLVIAGLDLSGIYKKYSTKGAPPYAPVVNPA